MKTANLITVSELCVYHNVDPDFMNSIHKAGLVNVKMMHDTEFIPASELRKLEKIISLHHLDINVSGIEAITYLLDRMEQLQLRMNELNNRLRIYEGD
jgi:hypothetical protein